MFALLTEKDYKGGTILEVCDESKWRTVSLLNDPGPQGPASITSRKKEAVNDILPYLSVDGELGRSINKEIMSD